MDKKKVHTKQGSVSYWTSANWNKSEKTLVFLHGLTGDHTMFDSQL